jgi:transcription elongation factor GreB
VSRAFVDESASESREENAPELKIPLPPGAKNYMTPEGARRLRVERDALLAVAPPRLRETERRIQYLSRMAAIMEVVEPGQKAPDRVMFGVWVSVMEEGREKTYRIVGVDESAPEKGWVSWVSPIARALTGRKAGETVRVPLPTGETVLTIRSISGTGAPGETS